LEALMKHLTMIFGPPPHMQAHLQHPHSPFFPPFQGAVPGARENPVAAAAAAAAVAAAPKETPAPTPKAATAGAAATPAGEKPRSAQETTQKLGGGEGREAGAGAEDFHTPAHSPQRGSGSSSLAASTDEPASEASQLPGLPGFPVSTGGSNESNSTGGTGGEGSDPEATMEVPAPAPPPVPLAPPANVPLVVPSHPAAPSVGSASTCPAPAFTLTLRRADHVPLGLDVRGDSNATCLTVENVRPGGAVEAWNRQCAGDTREIRAGDRIIMINGAEAAESMRQECLTKHLLRMTVLRGAAGAGSGEQTAPSPGLRAEAEEFVPQAAAAAAAALSPDGANARSP
jgi:hypothetical protein